MTIKLNDIIRINKPEKYKLHLACWNGECHPLDEFVADRANWLTWNEWRGRKNDWTRPFVFSLMQFYLKPDAWLFGGIFEVLERCKDKYTLRAIEEFEKYTGRLLISFHRYQGMRGRAFNLESYLKDFTVAEIFPEVYSGESFPGFENVSHDFGTLEAVFRAHRSDWKAALENVKGVYLIADRSNGKKYVGSAYGDAGIWGRWSCYMGTGHGWNDELVALISEKDLKYAREHFRFSILEVMVKSTPDEKVLSREAHWKTVLLTKEYGYNKN
ncbi:MAG: GIY-YIG nuclease family protein [Candidatus Bathyarchaeia archaeon]